MSGFAVEDDGLHPPSDSFYENETFWFSFFVPERKLGGWLYSAVRQHPGVTAGGMWVWDPHGSEPWDIVFYQQFAHLKAPKSRGPEQIDFPTGMSVTTLEPGMSYALTYDDRDRARVSLRFDALEPPVPLRHGAPPYPKASHYDQTGRVVGELRLDGERIDIDCYAMRDRSWGPRLERGYHRVGYTWLASPKVSLLTYTNPEGEGPEAVHAGYLRRDGVTAQLVSGRRLVRRDPIHDWVSAISVEVTDELGRTATAEGVGGSHMVLPHATAVCVCTTMRWAVEGAAAYGEDQDVWPIPEWRSRRLARRMRAGQR